MPEGRGEEAEEHDGTELQVRLTHRTVVCVWRGEGGEERWWDKLAQKKSKVNDKIPEWLNTEAERRLMTSTG